MGLATSNSTSSIAEISSCRNFKIIQNYRLEETILELQTTTREIIVKYAYRSLSENSIHSKQYFLFTIYYREFCEYY